MKILLFNLFKKKENSLFKHKCNFTYFYSYELHRNDSPFINPNKYLLSYYKIIFLKIFFFFFDKNE